MQIKQTLTTSLNDILNGIAQYCFHLSHVYQPQYPHPRASERKWMRTILCYVMCVWWKSLTLNIAQQSKVSPTATEAQLLATPTTIQTPYIFIKWRPEERKTMWERSIIDRRTEVWEVLERQQQQTFTSAKRTTTTDRKNKRYIRVIVAVVVVFVGLPCDFYPPIKVVAAAISA